MRYVDRTVRQTRVIKYSLSILQGVGIDDRQRADFLFYDGQNQNPSSTLDERWQFACTNAAIFLNGWQPTGIANWQTGFPFTIFSDQDNSFSAIGADRANLAASSVRDAVLSTGRSHAQLVSEWFNTSAFTSNGTFGNTGKNILRGPRLFDMDLPLLKNTTMTERLALEFWAEFYNAFNNVNFGIPDHGLLDSGFGQITSADSPRIMQLALKAIFQETWC